MPIPTIALYASPSSSVCQINSHASYDVDFNGRSTSSASASPSQKHMIGGLSCLLYSSRAEELGSLWHDITEELGSSSRYSLSSSVKRDQGRQSPISVLQAPNSSILSGSRSPPLRNIADLKSPNGELFNGFTRHALGSCVEYGSSPLTLNMKDIDPSSSSIVTEELTFIMDDNNFTELDLPPYAKDLLFEAQSKQFIFRDDNIVKAFCEAEKAHRGQMRVSGHPYLQHCLETAVLLASIGATPTVVTAGLLHDTVDDSCFTYNHISRTCGTEVADLVEGVSKLSHLSKLARENNTACKTAEADRLHTMFLGMADARAVLIKLADRLHNMITLDALPLLKQQRFAKETLEIFVPLANRLGISTWKEQLEDLCFEHLNPDKYQELSSELVKAFDEAMVTYSVEKLEQALTAGAVPYHWVSGRHKSLYSTYSKMLKYVNPLPSLKPVYVSQGYLYRMKKFVDVNDDLVHFSRKKLHINEIHDIHGFRLIVETEEDCYRALGVVHHLWHVVPGRFKDYIVSPKLNGYQSLHTVVMGDDMVPLEVQIRTKEMHLQAECGIAAHWRYKEGDSKHSSYIVQMVEWARWVVTLQCEAMSKDMTSAGFIESMKPPPRTFLSHSENFTFSCKPCYVSEGPIFVILIENDKMSVQEFPANSSVGDLLERAGRGNSRWTSYGFPMNEELRPRLNRVPVCDTMSKLKMGDVLELTPTIPDNSLTVYREEIQRMYDGGFMKPSAVPAARTLRT